MGALYDPEHVSRLFDEYGEREWERLDASASDRASLHIHRRFLDRFVRAGDRVLEVGAGPGRFTLELARLGARIYVTDISPGQIELHRERTSAVDQAVEAREVADVVDLSRFDDASFDAAVAFGGPVSYALDRRDRAMDELLRVTRPSGVVLLSVMSLVGAYRYFMSAVIDLARRYGTWALDELLETGDNYREEVGAEHRCHMFRWRELELFLTSRGCDILAASAANFVTVQNDELLEGVEPQLWDYVLRVEEQLAAEPGALDAGTHIVVAVRLPWPSPVGGGLGTLLTRTLSREGNSQRRRRLRFMLRTGQSRTHHRGLSLRLGGRDLSRRREPRYRGPWRLLAPDSHRLAAVSFTPLTPVDHPPSCPWRPSCLGAPPAAC